MALGLALTLGSALAWGAFDAWRKRLAEGLSPMPLLVLLSLGQVPVFAAWMGLAGGTLTDAAYWLPGVASMALNLLGNLLFLYAVRVSPLSLTAPLLSFVPVFAAVAAVPALGERPSVGQWLGVGLVVVGALVLHADAARGRGSRVGPGALVRALLRERGSLPMLGTAASWGAALVLDKQALQHAHPAVHGLVIMLGSSAALLLALAVRGRVGELRGLRARPGTYAVALCLGAAAMGLQLLAIPRVMLALLEAIKRTVGIVSAVALGRLMFDERVTVAKVLAVLVMSGGAALVLLGG